MRALDKFLEDRCREPRRLDVERDIHIEEELKRKVLSGELSQSAWRVKRAGKDDAET